MFDDHGPIENILASVKCGAYKIGTKLTNHT